MLTGTWLAYSIDRGEDWPRHDAMRHQRDAASVNLRGRNALPSTVPPLDAKNSLEALSDAATLVGMDASKAELIRIGSNAVFRFGPVVGRVSPDLTRLSSARQEVIVSDWLEAAQIPAVRALPVKQPLISHDRVVTLWESASDRVEYGTTTELANLLRDLHSKEASIDLPAHDPISKADARISSLDSIPAADRSFLLDRFEELANEYRQLTFTLQSGVIHGDANVGNVIRARDGRALLADLDGFAIGPREWDLILTALYYERYGWHTREEYEAFTSAYGFDVMTWSGYAVMRDLRELLMVAWLARSISSREGRTELAKRVETLRVNGSRMDWAPF